MCVYGTFGIRSAASDSQTLLQPFVRNEMKNRTLVRRAQNSSRMRTARVERWPTTVIADLLFIIFPPSVQLIGTRIHALPMSSVHLIEKISGIRKICFYIRFALNGILKQCFFGLRHFFFTKSHHDLRYSWRHSFALRLIAFTEYIRGWLVFEEPSELLSTNGFTEGHK